MKRRWSLVALAVGMWAVGLTAAAQARAADAAPTDVAIAWDTSGWQPRVKVAWQDAPGTANRVRFTDAAPDSFVLVGPSDPNVAFLEPGYSEISRPQTEISVVALDVGGIASRPGLSAPFDRNLEALVVDSLVPHGDTFTLKWHAPKVIDGTPGDPLDVFPSGNPYTAVYPYGDCGQTRGYWGSGTSYTPIQGSSSPGLWFIANGNLWGSSGRSIALLATEVPTAVPARTTYARPLIITGVSHRVTRQRGYTDPTCYRIPEPDPGRKVHLQARTTATSPWYGVTTTTTASNGTFRFAPVAIGTRQFRVVESVVSHPNTTVTFEGSGGALTAGVSAPATAGTLAWVRSARFLDPQIRRGEKSTAHVWVSPGLSTTALLQRWSSTGWVNVKQMPMVNGVAQYRFTPATNSTWRWVIPTTRAPNGLTIAWTASPGFSITVA